MSNRISNLAGNMRGASILWAALMLATTAVYADAPRGEFAGKWVLQNRQTLSGVDYANGVPDEITIATKDGAMDIERVSGAGAGGSETARVTYVNEQPTESVTAAHHKRIGSIAWDDNHRGFIETVRISGDGKGELLSRNTYTWKLVEGGKALTLVRESENVSTGEKWSMRGSYGRQELGAEAKK
jgi:hypothetical protein